MFNENSFEPEEPSIFLNKDIALNETESNGKFELNYRCELEEEIQKRGLKI
jgi:hypothetical protein